MACNGCSQQQPDCAIMGSAQIVCGCHTPVSQPAHKRQRLYVGPNTNEIILNIRRVANRLYGDIELDLIELEVERFNCCAEDAITLTPYSADKEGNVHFDLKDNDFLTDADTYPKGMYIGRLFIDGCQFDEIEIVKAPSFRVANASTGKGVCDSAGTGWVEPTCKTEDPVCEDPCPEHEGCVGCPHTIYVNNNTVKDSYLADIPTEDE